MAVALASAFMDLDGEQTVTSSFGVVHKLATPFDMAILRESAAKAKRAKSLKGKVLRPIKRIKADFHTGSSPDPKVSLTQARERYMKNPLRSRHG
jgi:hypothetical protein